jgi:hypothetical protein
MVSEDHPVRKLLAEVVKATVVNAEQVAILEDYIKKDWVVDQKEAHLLFRVNEALGSNHDDCPEWADFFVTTITRFVVMDMSTPGEIDEIEGDWLEEMLVECAVGNIAERRLIADIKKTTTSIKGKVVHRFQ